MLIFRALLDQTQRNAKPEMAVLFTKNQTKGTPFGTNDRVFACIKLNRLSISLKNSSSRPPNTTIECTSHKYLYGIRFLLAVMRISMNRRLGFDSHCMQVLSLFVRVMFFML